MKEIRAYVQPFVIGRLTQALLEIDGFPGISVSDCEGFGVERIEAGQDFTPFAAKKRIEILAPDQLVDVIVSTIMRHAHTGRPGDGKVYVFPVDYGVRIRTGLRDDDLV